MRSGPAGKIIYAHNTQAPRAFCNEVLGADGTMRKKHWFHLDTKIVVRDELVCDRQ
jgi:hypothetical protein